MTLRGSSRFERRDVLQAIAGLGPLAAMAAPGSLTQNNSAETGASGPPDAGLPTHMPRTDVHAHYLPPPYAAALAQAGMLKADGGMPIPTWSRDAHLATMAALGITTSILSVSSPGLQFLDPPAAARLARQINESGAQLTQEYPSQFGFFAILPVPDVTASLAELSHAFDHLKADGVVLETNSKGAYWGDEKFSPLFDELNRRQAVLFLHPTSPACFEQIGMGFPAPLIEFPFDSARTAVDLIFAGALRRHPDIKVILSHGGGALPILVSRIAMVADVPFVHPRPQAGGTEVIEEVRKLYFDLALSATRLNFQALLEITSASHILFGSDYPFAPPPAIAANTSRYEGILAGLSPEHRSMIEYRNAADLFPRLRRFIVGQPS
jgi:predicted TIM-barrel fold metal-dependent hydrolase